MKDKRRSLHQMTLLALREVERIEQAEAAGTELKDPLIAPMTDDIWLAAVVICLMDGFGCEVPEAVDIVHASRRSCLEARSRGLEPWQVAQFIEMKMGVQDTD